MTCWRSIRVPLHLIDRVYGCDNHDNAGDDIVDALGLVSEWPDQYRHRFSFDTAHSNPWYHALVFDIEGVSDQTLARLAELLAEKGLIADFDG